MAYILKWNILKIYIYPYGGLSKFNEDINRPLKEELLILLAGPFIQCIFYLVISHVVDYNILMLFNKYHLAILLFNLLPIYPLDGGKLINILLSYKISYKKSLIITFIISYLAILVISFISFRNIFTLNFIFVIFFLLLKLTEEYKKRNYYYQKFILERYINNYNFKKTKIINNIDKMVRDNKHLVKKDNHYYTEREVLEKKYKKL